MFFKEQRKPTKSSVECFTIDSSPEDICMPKKISFSSPKIKIERVESMTGVAKRMPLNTISNTADPYSRHGHFAFKMQN